MFPGWTVQDWLLLYVALSLAVLQAAAVRWWLGRKAGAGKEGAYVVDLIL